MTEILRFSKLIIFHSEIWFWSVFYSTCPPSGYLVDGLPLAMTRRVEVSSYWQSNTHAETIGFWLPRAYMENFCRKSDSDALLYFAFGMCIIQKLHYIVKFHMVEISEIMIIQKLRCSRSQLLGKSSKNAQILKFSKNDRELS